MSAYINPFLPRTANDAFYMRPPAPVAPIVRPPSPVAAGYARFPRWLPSNPAGLTAYGAQPVGQSGFGYRPLDPGSGSSSGSLTGGLHGNLGQVQNTPDGYAQYVVSPIDIGRGQLLQPGMEKAGWRIIQYNGQTFRLPPGVQPPSGYQEQQPADSNVMLRGGYGGGYSGVFGGITPTFNTGGGYSSNYQLR